MNEFPDRMRQSLLELLPRLRRFARSLARHEADADDILQLALERALAHAEQWQTDTGLDRWMYTIVRNAWIDEVRARQRRGTHLDIDELDGTLSAGDEDRALELESVEAAMARLPEEQSSAIALVLIEGLSYKEAAGILQVPIGTLTSRLARGRETLQKLLRPDMETLP